jgi:hypothetical protein
MNATLREMLPVQQREASRCGPWRRARRLDAEKLPEDRGNATEGNFSKKSGDIVL